MGVCDATRLPRPQSMHASPSRAGRPAQGPNPPVQIRQPPRAENPLIDPEQRAQPALVRLGRPSSSRRIDAGSPPERPPPFPLASRLTSDEGNQLQKGNLGLCGKAQILVEVGNLPVIQ